MAKWGSSSKKSGDEPDPNPADPKSFEVPASEAEPTGGQATVGKGTAEGTPVYPPPASDRSGERTANVPPAKQLPTKAPEEENPDEGVMLRAENAALRTALSSLGVDAGEVARQAAARHKAERAAEAGPTRRARVSFPGTTHTTPMDVDIPADVEEKDRDAAAAAAVHAKYGFSPNVQPVVTYPED